MEAGLPSFVLSVGQWLLYAEEADLLNVVLFGYTAEDWRDVNPEQAEKNLNIAGLGYFSDPMQLILLKSIS
jgi:hypothetical protein